MPNLSPRICPGCALTFQPLAENAVHCSDKCASRMKRMRRKMRTPIYLAPATSERPAVPISPAMIEQAQRDIGQKPVDEPSTETAESVLERLGYSSKIRPLSAEPLDPQPPIGGVPAPTDPDSPRRELPCGHRDIGVHPCPLCHPPVLETDNA